MINKRRLYNSIMESVSRSVKRALNETFLPSNNYVLSDSKKVVNSKKELRKIIEEQCRKDPNGSLNHLDVSRITDMSELFEKTNYNGDISEWDVSNVTNMQWMFWEAKKFNQPIENWDVSNVTKMKYMFCDAR